MTSKGDFDESCTPGLPARLSALRRVCPCPEKDDPVKEAQIKQQILKDVKKTCTPQKKQSDKAWQAMILSSEANQLLIKNAITAVKRDNLDAYWDAVSQVDCMEDY